MIGTREKRSFSRATIGLLALLVAGAYAFVFVTDFVRLIDNQVYFLLGKGLAEGRGYISYWEGESVPHTHFPPGYPALLAVAMRLGVTGVFGLKLVNGVLLALGISLAAVWTARVFENRALATIVAVAVGLNATVLLYGSLLTSEVAFLAVSMGALTCALEAGREAGTRRAWSDGRMYLLIGLLVAAFYIRTVGVALIAGCIGGMLLDGRRKAAALVAVGSAVGVMPWMLYVRRVGGTSYLDYLGRGQWDVESGNYLLWRLLDNAVGYAGSLLPATLIPAAVPALRGYEGIGWALAWVLFVAGGWGLARAGRHSAVIAAYLASTAYVLLLWPVAYRSERFLIPLVPLCAALVLRGIWEAGRKHASERTLTQAMLAALVVVSVPALWSARNYAEDPKIAPDHYEAIAAAVTQEARPGERVMTKYPGFVYYLTGVPSVSFRQDLDPDRIVSRLEARGVGLVVVTAEGPRDPAYRFLLPAIRAYPERFALITSIAKPPRQPPADYPYAAALYRFVEDPKLQSGTASPFDRTEGVTAE